MAYLVIYNIFTGRKTKAQLKIYLEKLINDLRKNLEKKDEHNEYKYSMERVLKDIPKRFPLGILRFYKDLRI